jgi:hypothetical protein
MFVEEFEREILLQFTVAMELTSGAVTSSLPFGDYKSNKSSNETAKW